MNADKTKCLLVTGKRLINKIVDASLNLTLENSGIAQIDSQKLLGVTIDKHLSFDAHVEELCKKLSQRIAVLRKIRRLIHPYCTGHTIILLDRKCQAKLHFTIFVYRCHNGNADKHKKSITQNFHPGLTPSMKFRFIELK